MWCEHEGAGDLLISRPDRLLGRHEVRRWCCGRADRSALAIQVDRGDRDCQWRAIGESRQLNTAGGSTEFNRLSGLKDTNTKTSWVGRASAGLRPLPVDRQPTIRLCGRDRRRWRGESDCAFDPAAVVHGQRVHAGIRLKTTTSAPRDNADQQTTGAFAADQRTTTITRAGVLVGKGSADHVFGLKGIGTVSLSARGGGTHTHRGLLQHGGASPIRVVTRGIRGGPPPRDAQQRPSGGWPNAGGKGDHRRHARGCQVHEHQVVARCALDWLSIERMA